MNLLNKNGGKTSAPQRNIKERLLEEEIANLRSIHQQSFDAFDRIVFTLKKMISYKTEHSGEERNEVEIQNTFIEDLGMIEEIFLAISEQLESDQDLYTSTVRFRQAEKNIDNLTFKKMMKGYEDFKQIVNQKIHRLEKDIQLLQTNGYHIYTQAQTLPPNRVLSCLKKVTLEKYMTLRGQVETVSEMIKKRLIGNQKYDQKEMKIPSPKSKMQQQVKLLRQISWKEVLEYEMMVKEINKMKNEYKKEQTKLKIAEQAIKKVDQNIQRIETGIKIVKQKSINKQDAINYIMGIKENIERHYIINANLFDTSKKRSKSCHAIMNRTGLNLYKADNKCKNVFGQCSNILGNDFLEESIYI